LKSTHLICKGSRRWDKPGSLFMEADEAFRDTEADAWATIGCASSGETRTPHTGFVWLISHHSAVVSSQNKPATSNQPAVLFSQNKSAPATSQTNRLPVGSARSASPSLAPWTCSLAVLCLGPWGAKVPRRGSSLDWCAAVQRGWGHHGFGALDAGEKLEVIGLDRRRCSSIGQERQPPRGVERWKTSSTAAWWFYPGREWTNRW
jgi:hypothetical protein